MNNTHSFYRKNILFHRYFSVKRSNLSNGSGFSCFSISRGHDGRPKRSHTIYDPIYSEYPEQANPQRPTPTGVASRGCGKRENERKATIGFEIFSQGDRDIWNQVQMLVIHLQECPKCHKITCKMVIFKFCEFRWVARERAMF